MTHYATRRTLANTILPCVLAVVSVLGMVSSASAILTLASSSNPAFLGTDLSYLVTVERSAPLGTVRFEDGGAMIPGCAAVALSDAGNTRTAACFAGAPAAGSHTITARYSGDAGSIESHATLTQVVAPLVPGTATVTTNPYGPLSVQGASLVGNTISNMTSNVVIQLGKVPGSPGVAAAIDFQGLNIGPGSELILRPGAAEQVVVLVDTGGNPSVIGGYVVAQNFGPDPPVLYLNNKNGVTITASGVMIGLSGTILDTLDGSWNVGQPIVNNGVIDAGVHMELLASQINGPGEFRGNSIVLRSFGNANNPANGQYFLQNGLNLIPSVNNATSTVALTLNAYGSAPQVLNLAVRGNATVWMPSDWTSGAWAPTNNPVVPLPNGVRRAGVPDPAYGGGSMIVQAAGSLALVDGATHDFAFPGGIVLKAGGDLDLNGVFVNQGWTTSGRSFQGVYLESPNIFNSKGDIEVYGNDGNWINFSTFPNSRVRAFALVRNPDGSAGFAPSDATAPHLNTYSTLTNTAASGGCWTCLVNPQPVNMFGP